MTVIFVSKPGHRSKMECLESGSCFDCFRQGHLARFCPRKWCKKCEEFGHASHVCPNGPSTNGFIEECLKRGLCFECGVSNHLARNCPNTSRKKINFDQSGFDNRSSVSGHPKWVLENSNESQKSFVADESSPNHGSDVQETMYVDFDVEDTPKACFDPQEIAQFENDVQEIVCVCFDESITYKTVKPNG
eukprot:TRINITY_DN483_c3_g1_i1.p1 TRINITY_DN483_c3_g1~~TRINITY_DN483_c3_g1_i1.p1  ORF type:complete len:190 (+),score=23.19 TRINITY_DN483_c3_g1_i1:84-653(+)